MKLDEQPSIRKLQVCGPFVN